MASRSSDFYTDFRAVLGLVPEARAAGLTSVTIGDITVTLGPLPPEEPIADRDEEPEQEDQETVNGSSRRNEYEELLNRRVSDEELARLP